MEEKNELAGRELTTVPLCLNCKAEVSGKYCAECGQSTSVERISLKYFFERILHVLELDKGFVFTILQMIKHPRIMIEDYLQGKRKNITSSVKLMFIVCVIMEIVFHFVKDSGGGFVTSLQIQNEKVPLHLEHYPRLVFLGLIFASSIGTRIVYYFKKYNFMEHIVINFFVLATSQLLATLFRVSVWGHFSGINMLLLLLLVNSFYYRIFENGKFTKKVFFRFCAVFFINSILAFFVLIAVVLVYYLFTSQILGVPSESIK